VRSDGRRKRAAVPWLQTCGAIHDPSGTYNAHSPLVLGVVWPARGATYKPISTSLTRTAAISHFTHPVVVFVIVIIVVDRVTITIVGDEVTGPET